MRTVNCPGGTDEIVARTIGDAVFDEVPAQNVDGFIGLAVPMRRNDRAGAHPGDDRDAAIVGLVQDTNADAVDIERLFVERTCVDYSLIHRNHHFGSSRVPGRDFAFLSEIAGTSPAMTNGNGARGGMGAPRSLTVRNSRSGRSACASSMGPARRRSSARDRS